MLNVAVLETSVFAPLRECLTKRASFAAKMTDPLLVLFLSRPPACPAVIVAGPGGIPVCRIILQGRSMMNSPPPTMVSDPHAANDETLSYYASSSKAEE